jgi:PTH1 family peptidyl-tRNA hydrolase
MKSIIYQLETEEFPRIRIGIGECPHGIDAAEYVLGEFTPEEQEVIAKTLEKAANAVETIIVEGIGAAMNKYN